jgi:hypothetical protein
LRDSLRTQVALHAKILALRHQLLVLQRGNKKQRLRLSPGDRLLWIWLSRIWPEWRSALRIVGKIAAEEYERLLSIASLQVLGRPLPREKGAPERLIEELEAKGLHPSGRQGRTATSVDNAQQGYSPGR